MFGRSPTPFYTADMAFAGLIVANRAYIDHTAPPNGDAPVQGAGGLVAALSSAIDPWDGTKGSFWIGAGRGEYDQLFVDERGIELLATPRGSLLHQRLFFDEETWAGHYDAVANSFLWPALHLVRPGLRERARFFPRPAIPAATDWDAFERVNRAFARAAGDAGQQLAWIHDYQLALVPRLLRDSAFDGRIGYFLHTPFPRIDCLEMAARPFLARFVAGVLGADLAGFQAERDRTNFQAAATELFDATVEGPAITCDGHTTMTGVFPVGVNAGEVSGAAGGALPPAAATLTEAKLPLVAGLERADFTKGIPERLEAVARAYERGARFAYFGASSPTRQGVAIYEGFAEVIAEAAERAASAASRAGCPFVQQSSSLTWPEVVAVLAAADVVFTPSLADGMNLVPLQAAIAQAPRLQRGVILAGRDAGVCHAFGRYLGDGLEAVDPLDGEAMTAALIRAVAGELPPMSDQFVAAVADADAARWAEQFTAALGGDDAGH